jgi:hypothetical protein
MMYITDKGCAYSDGFYQIINNRVINPFTNKSLGIVVRTSQSNNFLCLKEKRERSLFQRLYFWIVREWTRIAQGEEKVYRDYVRKIGEGKLADDMRKLKKAGN